MFLWHKDQIMAVHEALNSPEGRRELRTLKGSETTIRLAVKRALNQGKLRAAVCQHTNVNAGTKKKSTLVFVAGPSFLQEGFVDRSVLIVDRLPDRTPACEIHIQTASPKL
jgi:hypothetical protein